MSKRAGPSLVPPNKPSRRKTKRGGIAIQYTPTPQSESNSVPAPSVRVWDKRISKTGRLGGSRTTVWAAEEPTAPPDIPILDPGAEDAATWEDVTSGINAVSIKVKRITRNDSTKMTDWLKHVRQTYIDELVRHDGLGDAEACINCSICDTNIADVRCMDCSVTELFCGDCVVKRHQRNPLHRIEKWDKGYFQRTTLSQCGMTVQLGHEEECPAPEPIKKPFLIFDMNGIHKLQLAYCGCSKTSRIERFQQLLRERWYPATFDRPRTAFTFDVLDTYHKLTLQGKLTLYDFYHGILHKTDNCGKSNPIYRYHELARCVRQWRHLKLAKRGGSAHNPGGVIATPEGSLAVECPPCPHPGRNSPLSLEDVPADKRWLHALFLAIDANFKLKLKNRGINDPELGSGWAYFVEQSKYEEHLHLNMKDVDLRGCGSTFHAVNDAGSKFSKGYSVTGVVAAVCARHNFVMKNGVGDLQLGERQCNIDYVVLSTLKYEVHKQLKLSYDIVCSWSKNFKGRMEDFYDIELQLGDDVTILFLIPKFHLPAHGISCHTRYSFNFNRFVGRTHGETVEQEWSHINGAALMTREMGAGARHGSLDDHWGGWNWAKLLALGDQLSRGLKKSTSMAKKHQALADKTSNGFPASTVSLWQAMVAAWDQNHNNPDPYEEPESSINLAEERRLMAEEEANEVGRGQHFPHKVTAAVFVRMGLDIEEQQRTLLIYVNRKIIRTSIEKAALQEKRNGLRRQIEKWRDIQLVYMPGVASLRGLDPDPDARSTMNEERPEIAKLWLPSDVPEAHRASACLRGVVVKEQRFRAAQVHDALVELRRARRINKGVWTHFKINITGTGQRSVTRSRTIINNSTKRIDRAFKRYNACRNALLVLDPGGEWKEKYLPLTQADNRGPGKELNEDKEGDGDYTVSWIWYTTPGAARQPTAETEEFNDAMRVEWATSVARADRWWEERELLLEEMGRTLVFLEWKAKEWELRAHARTNNSPDILCGLVAYATKQAAVHRRLASKFRNSWEVLLKILHLTADWVEVITPESAPSTDQPVSSNAQPVRPLRANRTAGVPADSDSEDDGNDELFNDDSEKEAEEIDSEDLDLDLE